MALVFKRVSLVLQHGAVAASGRRPPRRNHHVWPEEMKTHLNCRERGRALCSSERNV